MSKYYEHITESVWSDIHKRSNGEQIRKEDDLNSEEVKNLVNCIEWFATRVVWSKDYEATLDDLCTYIEDFFTKGSKIRVDIPKFINNVKVKWDSFYKGLVDEFINKEKEDYMKGTIKVKGTIKESVWSDIHSRSNGEYKRIEDIIHLDDRYVDKFNIILKNFVETIVYYENYNNTFDAFKRFLETECIVKWCEVVDGHTVKFSDIILPYVKDNWKKFDNIEKQIDELIVEEEEKIKKLGFKKEPGKSIVDTLYDWWGSLDNDKKEDILSNDLWDAAEERFYEDHLDDDEFTGEDLEADEEWDRTPFTKQIEIYLHYSKMNESVWSDIHKRSNGSDERKEDTFDFDKLERVKDTDLQLFANDIVFCENYDNSIDGFKAFVKRYDYRFMIRGSVFLTIDELISYVEKNWQKEHFGEFVDGLIKEKEQEISKMNFKKEPGKSIDRTLNDWWNSLDEDERYEVLLGCGTEDHSKFEKYSDDELWEDLDYFEQMNAYMKYNKMNESVWSDIHKRSNGDKVRKEDEMTDDDFELLYMIAKMFKNTVKLCSDPRNPVDVHYDDTCDDFVEFITGRKEDHRITYDGRNVVEDDTYDKLIMFVKNNWKDCHGIYEFMCRHLNNLNECEGVPGGATPANVGGMGAAYFPGPNGEPGSGDLPSPTGIVYHQVAPFGVFIKELKKKKKKKKFRKEDEPCSHSPNKKVYDYVDDYREYVDRTYNNMDRKR